MWAVILTLVLNLQAYPLFNLPDGSPVYMRTTSYRVAVGQFATKAECQAYAGTITTSDSSGNTVLAPGVEFLFSYTDVTGTPQSIAFQNLPVTVDPCQKVL